MSAEDLEVKLTRLSHFTTPPADVVADALTAYAAHVAELEAVIARKDTRIGEEVSFQRHIRQSEQETRHELIKRHEAERRALIQELGFAATIHDRALRAHREGRKTIKLGTLLEGRPDQDIAA